MHKDQESSNQIITSGKNLSSKPLQHTRAIKLEYLSSSWMKGSTEVKTAIQEFQDSLLWMTSRQSSITSDVTEFADQHPSADDTCPGIITGYTKISSHNIEYNFQILYVLLW